MERMEKLKEFFDDHPKFPYYTSEQMTLIRGAVKDSSSYVENAYQSLAAMLRFYFFTDYGLSSLSFDADEQPEVIAGQLFGILDLLKEARRDLNALANPTNEPLYPINRDIKVRRYYLDNYELDGMSLETTEDTSCEATNEFVREYLCKVSKMVDEFRVR